MLLSLIIGIPIMVLCLLLQAIVVIFCLRRYARARLAQNAPSTVHDFKLLSMVMLLMMLGNFLQATVWAALFVLLGEFDFDTAVYYSAVNFATLGYGDIVLSQRWRLLGPLEAAHGILMFGLSTAVMTAAVMDVVKLARVRSHANEGD